jgi:hypothetical protein
VEKDVTKARSRLEALVKKYGLSSQFWEDYINFEQ